MKHVVFLFLVFLSACTVQDQSRSAGRMAEIPITFEARSGEVVEAFEGTFVVPENRASTDSRDLTLHYVRFPATSENPGAPVVYLAGGPGGSGIWFAKQWRFPLFMAFREFGDVIALDQRGTGASNDTPDCTSSHTIDDKTLIKNIAFVETYQAALQECLRYWADQGIDVHGYNTMESVADLEALRVHLGVEKLTLWGISYGSHLALAALKEMDDRIERIVIASAEGLDQTLKLPVRTDAYFDRLQEAINTQPAGRGRFPDIKDLIRRVHAALENEPMMLQVPRYDGSSVEILFQLRDMQRLASAMIADPKRFAVQLVRIYAALDNSDTEPLIKILERWYEPSVAISFELMPTMMDISSGVSAERRSLIERQVETALLGIFLNETLYLIESKSSYELNDRFRLKPESDVPLLLLSGSLDGRTYIESQREAVSGMTNLEMVTVRNAGHNLFMSSPKVTATIQEFMRGNGISEHEIIIDLPEF